MNLIDNLHGFINHKFLRQVPFLILAVGKTFDLVIDLLVLFSTIGHVPTTAGAETEAATGIEGHTGISYSTIVPRQHVLNLLEGCHVHERWMASFEQFTFDKHSADVERISQSILDSGFPKLEYLICDLIAAHDFLMRPLAKPWLRRKTLRHRPFLKSTNRPLACGVKLKHALYDGRSFRVEHFIVWSFIEITDGRTVRELAVGSHLGKCVAHLLRGHAAVMSGKHAVNVTVQSAGACAMTVIRLHKLETDVVLVDELFDDHVGLFTARDSIPAQHYYSFIFAFQ